MQPESTPQIPLEGQEIVVYTQSMAQDTKPAYTSLFKQYPHAEKGVVGAKPPLPEPKKRGGINWEMMKFVGEQIEGEGDDDAVVERMYGSEMRAEAKLQEEIARKAEQARLDRIAEVRDGLELLHGGLDQPTDIKRATPKKNPLIRIKK